jgi:hypothetical protein
MKAVRCVIALSTFFTDPVGAMILVYPESPNAPGMVASTMLYSDVM